MNGIFDIKPPAPKKPIEKRSFWRYRNQSRRKRSGTLLIFVIMVLGFIFFFSIINNNKTKTADSQNANSDNESDATIVPTAATKQEVKKTQSTPEASISISPTPTAAKSNIQITILNGSEEAGAANSAKEELQENGIEVSKIGNSQNNYSRTVIYYTNENKSLAEKIQEILANLNPQLLEDNSLADNENILVVIGK